MGLFQTLLQVTAHPAAQPFLQQLLGGDAGTRREREVAELRAAFQEVLRDTPGIAAGTVAGAAVVDAAVTPSPTGAASLAPVRDQLLRVSGALKESLRFAREDGPQHPEVRQRVQDAQAWIVDLERYQLRPEVLATMPPAVREQAEAMLPAIRRLRQQLGEARSVDDLTETAAWAGRLASHAQIATAVAGVPGTRVAPPPVPPPTPGAYSQYAPDMAVDTSCLACGRSHLAGIEAALSQAAADARTQGWASPTVQDRLTMAQEELHALLDYDWTPERLARSPAHEQQIVRPLVADAQTLLTTLAQAQTPDAVDAAAQQVRAMRTALAAAEQEVPQ